MGVCSNCHTMHNSQGGQPMIYLAPGETDTSPKGCLVRGTCLGCHGRGMGQKLDPITGAPQVLGSGTDTEELAGGDFAYILGTKGSGAADSKGHNVIDIGNPEGVLTQPPGHKSNTHLSTLQNTVFTCAGLYGCHGRRTFPVGEETPPAIRSLAAIKGSHHRNWDGKCNVADNVYNSYRFLNTIYGYENQTDKWQNKSDASHNEYYGKITPLTDAGGCPNCHGAALEIMVPSHTISGFCNTCHANFHQINGAFGGTGIGSSTSSPFLRHPTDVVLPSDLGKEYRLYNTPDGTVKGPYRVIAPVARTTVYDSPSSTVTPGTDVVMCLSCHSSHATNYDHMMRWDYKSSTLSTALSGCNVCHTSKN